MIGFPRASKTLLSLLTAALALSSSAYAARVPKRTIVADVSQASTPVDRFFDLSVGSDYPGTLIRDDSQAQLKVAVDELGFRYIRFHAIFHDVLGTVKKENGQITYDWTKIDQLYDDLLARRIKPFVELGFTPQALASSNTRSSTGKAILPTPILLDGMTLLQPLSVTLNNVTERRRSGPGISRFGTSLISPAFGKLPIRTPILHSLIRARTTSRLLILHSE